MRIKNKTILRKSLRENRSFYLKQKYTLYVYDNGEYEVKKNQNNKLKLYYKIACEDIYKNIKNYGHELDSRITFVVDSIESSRIKHREVLNAYDLAKNGWEFGTMTDNEKKLILFMEENPRKTGETKKDYVNRIYYAVN